MSVSVYHYNYENPYSMLEYSYASISLPVNFEAHLSKTLPWLQLQVKKIGYCHQQNGLPQCIIGEY